MKGCMKKLFTMRIINNGRSKLNKITIYRSILTISSKKIGVINTQKNVYFPRMQIVQEFNLPFCFSTGNQESSYCKC